MERSAMIKPNRSSIRLMTAKRHQTRYTLFFYPRSHNNFDGYPEQEKNYREAIRQGRRTVFLTHISFSSLYAKKLNKILIIK
jgi:hypothetical protein